VRIIKAFYWYKHVNAQIIHSKKAPPALQKCSTNDALLITLFSFAVIQLKLLLQIFPIRRTYIVGASYNYIAVKACHPAQKARVRLYINARRKISLIIRAVLIIYATAKKINTVYT